MERFIAEVKLSFEAPDLRSGGEALRRLRDAARTAGFELHGGRVRPATPEDEVTNKTSHVPRDPADWSL